MGEKAAVIPVGRPVTLRVTLELNPDAAVTSSETVPCDPAFRLTDEAPALSVSWPEMVSVTGAVFVTPPPEAVMVSAYDPLFAAEDACTVSVLDPLPGEAMLEGEKEAVTPEGSPVTESPTAELKVPVPAVVTEMCADLPSLTAIVEGALSVNEADEFTVTWRLRVAVLVTPPPVAVMVSVEVPADALLPAVSVRTELPDPGAASIGLLNEAVTPGGNPLTESDTDESNPPLTETCALIWPLDPRATDREFAPTLRAMLGLCTGAVQLVTRRLASTDPRPEAWSYPVPALNPVRPGTLLLPEVMSWNTAAPPPDCAVASE